MLILTRKLGESIRIGDDIKIVISDIKGKQIRIGIEAPEDVSIHREEVYQIIQKQNLLAAQFDHKGNKELVLLWERLKKHKEERK